MTLLDFQELLEYWKMHPPVHLLLAAQIGAIKPHATSSEPGSLNTISFSQPEDLATLAASLGPGFSPGDVHFGLPPTILDFRELKRCRGALERIRPGTRDAL